MIEFYKSMPTSDKRSISGRYGSNNQCEKEIKRKDKRTKVKKIQNKQI